MLAGCGVSRYLLLCFAAHCRRREPFLWHKKNETMIWWQFTSSLGGSQLTMPVALAITLWLCATLRWRLMAEWCGFFGVVLCLVVLSKQAFLGWGIGLRGIDFVGFSGHATRAAAV